MPAPSQVLVYMLQCVADRPYARLRFTEATDGRMVTPEQDCSELLDLRNRDDELHCVRLAITHCDLGVGLYAVVGQFGGVRPPIQPPE